MAFGSCKTCGAPITVKNVTYQSSGKAHIHCRYCTNKKMAEATARYKLRHGRKNAMLKARFGITEIEYNKILESQSNVCAICKKPEKIKDSTLCVDHNHSTRKVRGLLCRSCNTAIGLLLEDEDIIWNMLEYLKKHNWSKVA